MSISKTPRLRESAVRKSASLDETEATYVPHPAKNLLKIHESISDPYSTSVDSLTHLRQSLKLEFKYMTGRKHWEIEPQRAVINQLFH